MSLIDKFKKYGLVKCAMDAGGSIHPLIIPADKTNGTGLMNPSIFIDGDKILCNIRHVNYTLYHSERKQFQHRWGPLQYIHPENDVKLRTWNYMAELNEDLTIKTVNQVDTSKFDVEPLWEFIGLEDARLFRWDGKLYHSGVRRDTTTNGQGRMELSELEMTPTGTKEIKRTRIPTPGNKDTYCEKNWMPVIDQPYTYVKWCNPTEVVNYDINKNVTSTIKLDESTYKAGMPDFRGSSQVIPWGDYYIALIHEVNLFKSPAGEKDGTYLHRFLVWDKDWNLLKYTDTFSFMKADIEFCCGAAWLNGELLLSFGFQDNAAFIVKMPEQLLRELLEE
jgi:hypothetical protein